jgi:hypothetical protein|uniref:Uncharacterized protein n=1 Tax=Populus trichocarpa TaxID=3694 RepID=A0A2K1Y362_POPTR
MFDSLFFEGREFGFVTVICLEHPLSKYHLSFFFYEDKSQLIGFVIHKLVGPFGLVNVHFDIQTYLNLVEIFLCMFMKLIFPTRKT